MYPLGFLSNPLCGRFPNGDCYTRNNPEIRQRGPVSYSAWSVHLGRLHFHGPAAAAALRQSQRIGARWACRRTGRPGRATSRCPDAQSSGIWLRQRCRARMEGCLGWAASASQRAECQNCDLEAPTSFWGFFQPIYFCHFTFSWASVAASATSSPGWSSSIIIITSSFTTSLHPSLCQQWPSKTILWLWDLFPASAWSV